jgi:hypothetical protein
VKNKLLFLLLGIFFVSSPLQAKEAEEPFTYPANSISPYLPPPFLSLVGGFLTHLLSGHAASSSVLSWLLLANTAAQSVYNPSWLREDIEGTLGGLAPGNDYLAPMAHLPLLKNAQRLLDLEQAPDPVLKPKYDLFPVSDEFEMGKAWPILKQAPRGVYVSVGSERSFRGASMADATALVVVDVGVSVLRFSRINRELLKADTLRRYLDLRFGASFEEWVAFQDNQKIQMRLTKEDHVWWKENVALNRRSVMAGWPREIVTNVLETIDSCYKDWQASAGSTRSLIDYVDYETGNYTYDEVLYQRLHVLALSDKIFVVGINLVQPEAVTQLVGVLRNEGEPVAVLDIDNAFLRGYIGDKTTFLLESFLPIAQNKGIVLGMLTNYNRCFPHHQYFGLSFSFLKKWQGKFDLSHYMDSNSVNWYNRLAGRLFGANDKLPMRRSWHHYLTRL